MAGAEKDGMRRFWSGDFRTDWRDYFEVFQWEPSSTLPHYLCCFECGEMYEVREGRDPINDWLQTGVEECPECHEQIDLFDVLAVGLQRKDSWHGIVPVGFRRSVIWHNVRVGQRISFDLTQHGVPADALLARVAHDVDPSSGVTLVDFRTPDSARRLDHSVELFAVPSDKAGTSQVGARCMVLWLDADQSSVAARFMVSALHAFAAKRYPELLVHATTAVEVALKQMLINRSAQLGISKRHAERSSRRALAWMLVGLSMPSAGLLPRPPPQLWDNFDSLRNSRNELVHEGGANIALEAAAEHLTAGILMLRYVQLCDQQLASVRTGGGR